MKYISLNHFINGNREIIFLWPWRLLQRRMIAYEHYFFMKRMRLPYEIYKETSLVVGRFSSRPHKRARISEHMIRMVVNVRLQFRIIYGRWPGCRALNSAMTRWHFVTQHTYYTVGLLINAHVETQFKIFSKRTPMM